MSFIKQDYICPNCKKKNKYKLYAEIDNKYIQKVINRELFTQCCKYCKTSIITDYSVNLVTENYKIIYTPNNNEIPKEKCEIKTRVCDLYDDFKEKILIFEDELNDVLIEFIKSFIMTQMTKEELGMIDNIRYNTKNQDDLIFSLIGLNKIVKFPIIDYMELIKKCKLKKIKKIVMIDQYTYKKYIKI